MLLTAAVWDSFQIQKNEVLSVPAASGLLANDTPNPGVTVVETLSPSYGATLDVSTDGSLVIDSVEDFAGATKFHYLVADGSDSDWAQVHIQIRDTVEADLDPNGDATVAQEYDPYSGGVIGTSNFGTATTLVVDNHPSGLLQQSHLKFSNSGITDEIASVELKLRVESLDPYGSSQPVAQKLYRVPTHWDEPTITWDNQPSSTGSEIASFAVSESGEITIDVTDAFLDSISGSDPHFAVVVGPDVSQQGSVVYSSREAADGAHRPRLVVTTVAETSPPTPLPSSVSAHLQYPYVFKESDFAMVDTDGDSLWSIHLNSLPGIGSLSLAGTPLNQGTTVTGKSIAAGELVYHPDSGTTATSTNFALRVNDAFDAGVDPSTMSIEFDGSAPPEISVGTVVPIAEDSSAQPITITLSDLDTPINSVQLTGTSNDQSLVVNHAIEVVGSGATRTLSITPQPDAYGTVTIQLHAFDGEHSSRTEFNLEIQPLPDPIWSEWDAYQTDVDQTLTVSASEGLLSNDVDVDHDGLTIQSYTQPADGAVTVQSDGSFTFTPNPSFIGFAEFQYTATSGPDVDIGRVVIEVAPSGITEQTAEADAKVSEEYDPYGGITGSSANFGSASTLVADEHPSGLTQRSHVRFDLSAFGAPVDSATLQLSVESLNDYGQGGTGIAQRAFLVSDSWDEPTITWDNQPASGVEIASWEVAGTDTISLDVTDWVNSQIGQGAPNLSLVIQTAAGALGMVTYHSREAADQSKRPQLTITEPVGNADLTSGTLAFDVLRFDSETLDDQAFRFAESTDAPLWGVTFHNAPRTGQLLVSGSPVRPGQIVSAKAIEAGELVYKAGEYEFNANEAHVAFSLSAPNQQAAAAEMTAITFNDVPIAEWDTFSFTQNETLTITVDMDSVTGLPSTGLLANDADAQKVAADGSSPASDPLRVIHVTQPDGGVVEFGADGSFTFTPFPNFASQTFFEYTVSDGIDVSVGRAYLLPRGGDVVRSATADGMHVDNLDPNNTDWWHGDATGIQLNAESYCQCYANAYFQFPLDGIADTTNVGSAVLSLEAIGFQSQEYPGPPPNYDVMVDPVEQSIVTRSHPAPWSESSQPTGLGSFIGSQGFEVTGTGTVDIDVTGKIAQAIQTGNDYVTFIISLDSNSWFDASVTYATANGSAALAPSLSITVDNLAPTTVASSVSVPQGRSYPLAVDDFDMTDPESDPLNSVTIASWPTGADGTLLYDGEAVDEVTTVTARELTLGKLVYQATTAATGAVTAITYRVADAFGEAANTETLTVNVVDPISDPILTLSEKDPGAAKEAQSVVVLLDVQDLGDQPVAAWEVNWADGTAETYPVGTSAISHIYSDDGTYTVEVTPLAPDPATIYNAAATLSLVVADVAAVVSAHTDYTLQSRGKTPRVYFSASDVQGDDVTQWEIDWGDGGDPQIAPAGATFADYSTQGRNIGTGNVGTVVSVTAVQSATVRPVAVAVQQDVRYARFAMTDSGGEVYALDDLLLEDIANGSIDLTIGIGALGTAHSRDVTFEANFPNAPPNATFTADDLYSRSTDFWVSLKLDDPDSTTFTWKVPLHLSNSLSASKYRIFFDVDDTLGRMRNAMDAREGIYDAIYGTLPLTSDPNVTFSTTQMNEILSLTSEVAAFDYLHRTSIDVSGRETPGRAIMTFTERFDIGSVADDADGDQDIGKSWRLDWDRFREQVLPRRLDLHTPEVSTSGRFVESFLADGLPAHPEQRTTFAERVSNAKARAIEVVVGHRGLSAAAAIGTARAANAGGDSVRVLELTYESGVYKDHIAGSEEAVLADLFDTPAPSGAAIDNTLANNAEGIQSLAALLQAGYRARTHSRNVFLDDARGDGSDWTGTGVVFWREVGDRIEVGQHTVAFGAVDGTFNGMELRRNPDHVVTAYRTGAYDAYTTAPVHMAVASQDLATPNIGPPITLTRYFSSKDHDQDVLRFRESDGSITTFENLWSQTEDPLEETSIFGFGWSHSLGTHLRQRVLMQNVDASFRYNGQVVPRTFYAGERLITWHMPDGSTDKLIIPNTTGWIGWSVSGNGNRVIYDAQAGTFELRVKGDTWYHFSLVDNVIARLDKIVDRMGNTVSLSYLPGTNQIDEVFSSFQDGPTTKRLKFSYDPGNPHVSSVEDVRRGLTWTYDYESYTQHVNGADRTFHFLKTVTGPADASGQPKIVQYDYQHKGVVTWYNTIENEHRYQPASQLISVDEPGKPTETFSYYTNGRLKEVVKSTGESSFIRYDDASNSTATYKQDETHSDSFFNDSGGLARKEYSDGTSETNEYIGLGRVERTTSRTGQTTEMRYDAVGNISKMKDENGVWTKYTYDGTYIGLVTQIARDVSEEDSSELHVILTRELNEDGNAIFETDAEGNTTAYGYDERGLVETKTSSARLASVGATHHLERYTYNEFGQLTSRSIPTTIDKDQLHQQTIWPERSEFNPWLLADGRNAALGAVVSSPVDDDGSDAYEPYHLTDGRLGDSSTFRFPAVPNKTATFTLRHQQWIDAVSIGRDRVSGTNDSVPTDFIVEVSTGNGYTTVFDSYQARQSQQQLVGDVNGNMTFQAVFSPVEAKHVRLTFTKEYDNQGTTVYEPVTLDEVVVRRALVPANLNSEIHLTHSSPRGPSDGFGGLRWNPYTNELNVAANATVTTLSGGTQPADEVVDGYYGYHRGFNNANIGETASFRFTLGSASETIDSVMFGVDRSDSRFTPALSIFEGFQEVRVSVLPEGGTEGTTPVVDVFDSASPELNGLHGVPLRATGLNDETFTITFPPIAASIVYIEFDAIPSHSLMIDEIEINRHDPDLTEPEVKRTFDAVYLGVPQAQFDSSDEVVLEHFTYDSFGYLDQHTDATGIVIDYDHDAYGQQIKTTSAAPYEENGADQIVTRQTYSLDGNVTSTTDGNGNVTTFTYDSANRLIRQVNPDGTLLETDYDANGNVIATRDEFGVETRFEYDIDNRPISVTHADGATESTRYDAAGRILEQTAANNQTTLYRYDDLGRLESKTYPDGGEEKWTYDSFNNIASHTTVLGAVTEFHNDRLNRVVASISYAPGTPDRLYDSAMRYEYDRDGNRSAVHAYDLKGLDQSQLAANWWESSFETLANETRTTLTEYDAQRRPLKVTDAEQNTREFTYDVAGRLIREIDGRGSQTDYLYDGAGRPYKTIHPAAEEGAIRGISTTLLDGHGNVVEMTNPHGYATTYEFDRRNRAIKRTNALGESVTTAYEVSAEPGETRVMVSTDDANNQRQDIYDLRGRLVKTIEADPDPDTNIESPVWLYSYDVAGRLVDTTDPRLGVTTHGQFDALNRVQSVLSPLVDHDLDPNTPEVRFETDFQYDAAGNLLLERDALGRVTEYEYDAFGRLTKTILPDPDKYYSTTDRLVEESDGSLPSAILINEYNGFGELTTSITQFGDGGPQRETVYQHDALGRLLSTKRPDPDGVVDVLTLQSPITLWTYDAAGNVLTETETWFDPDENDLDVPDQRTTIYNYDGLGRLRRTELPHPDPAQGGAAPFEIREYDLVGNLTETTDRLGRITDYAFDILNRETRRLLPAPNDGDSRPYTVTRFDNRGNVSSTVDPLGRETGYQYDGLNRQVKVIRPSLAPELGTPGATTTFAYDASGNLISETDPLLRTTTFEFDSLNRRTNITPVDPDPTVGSPFNESTVTRYDAVGNATHVTDLEGNTVVTAYDSLDRVTSVTLPAPATGGQAPVRLNIYDIDGNLKKSIDELGNETEFEYDDLDRQIKVTFPDPDGGTLNDDLSGAPVTLTHYDNAGDIDRVEQQFYRETDPGNPTIRVRDFGYDRLHRRTSEELPDPVTGQPSGILRWFGYDDANNLISETDIGGRTTVYVLDNWNRRTEIRQPDPNTGVAEQGPIAKTDYDVAGNLIRTIDPLGNTTEYRYDALDRQVEVVLPDVGDGEAVTTTEYDLAGNMIESIDALGRSITYSYDDWNRLTDTVLPAGHPEISSWLDVSDYRDSFFLWFDRPDTVKTRQEYDNVGNVTAVVDELGRRTEFRYDNLYRQTEIILPATYSGQAESERTTTFGYDLVGNLVSSTDALGRTTTTDYDNHYRPIRTTLPALHSLAAGAYSEKVYDEIGRIQLTSDTMGRETTFGYDLWDRETLRILPDPDFDYQAKRADPNGTPSDGDLISQRVVSAYDSDGNLDTQTLEISYAGTPVVTDNRVTDYEYDELNRLIKTTFPDPYADTATALFSETEYNDAGLVTAEIDTRGHRTEYYYDQRNQLSKVVSPDSPTGGPIGLPRTEYEYDQVGNQVTIREFNEYGQHRETKLEYDARDRVIETRTPRSLGYSSATTGISVETFYDDTGNVIATREYDQGGFTGLRLFEYDAQDRLIQEAWASSTIDPFGASLLRRNHYRYDVVGNRTDVLDTELNHTQLVYDNWNRLIAEHLPDPDGSVTEFFEPDPENPGDTRIRHMDAAFRDDMNLNYSDAWWELRGGDTLQARWPMLWPDWYDNPGTRAFWGYDTIEDNVHTFAIVPVPPTGPVTRWNYDDAGNVIAAQSPVDHSTNRTENTYDQLDRLVATVSPDPDQQSIFEMDFTISGQGATHDAGTFSSTVAGENWALTYDANPDSNDTTTNEFVTIDGAMRVQDWGGSGTVTSQSVTVPADGVVKISGRGLAIGSEDDVFESAGEGVTWFYTINAGAPVTHVIGSSPVRGGTRIGHVFDDVSVTAGDVLQVGFTVNVEGEGQGVDVNLLNIDFTTVANSPTTVYAYDGAGDRITETVTTADDGTTVDTITTTYEYDRWGRRHKVFDGNQTGLAAASRKATVYRYDGEDNLTSLTDPEGNQTSFDYDTSNRLEEETNPLTQKRLLEYDGFGNLVKRTDRNGRIIRYFYDELDRPIRESWYDDQDSLLREIDFTINDQGRVSSVSDPDSTYNYIYDVFGNVVQKDNVGTPGVSDVTFNYLYTPDDLLRRRTESVAGKQVVTIYAHDNLNRVERIEQTGTTVDKAIDYTFNAIGQYETVERFSGLSSVDPIVRTTLAYDQVNRPVSIDHNGPAAGDDLASYALEYDVASRIRQVTTTYDGTDDISTYQLDDANQLTDADYTLSGGATNPDRPAEDYSYDDAGNHTGGSNQIQSNNRLVDDGVYTYTYDDEGNRKTRTEVATGLRTTYTWDHRNRLTEVLVEDTQNQDAVVSTTTYSYDHNDRRISKVHDEAGGTANDVTEYFVYDQGHVTTILDTAGAVQNHYLHGAAVDEILADETGAGQVTWPLADHQNTIRDLAVEQAGQTTIAHHRVYDSFGNLVPQPIAGTNPVQYEDPGDHRFGYTGRMHDEDVELVYYRARWYDPVAAGFLSEDPMGFDAGDINLRRYVGNSPVDHTDPSGKFLKKIFREIGRVIDDIGDAVSEAFDDIGDFFEDAWEDTRDFVSENPWLAAGIGLAGGALFVGAFGGFVGAFGKLSALASKAFGSITTGFSTASSGIGGTFSVNVGNFASFNAGVGISGTNAFASASINVLGYPVVGVGKTAGLFGSISDPFASSLTGNFSDALLSNALPRDFRTFEMAHDFVGGGRDTHTLIGGNGLNPLDVGSFLPAVAVDTAESFGMAQLAGTGVPTAINVANQTFAFGLDVLGTLSDVFLPSVDAPSPPPLTPEQELSQLLKKDSLTDAERARLDALEMQIEESSIASPSDLQPGQVPWDHGPPTTPTRHLTPWERNRLRAKENIAMMLADGRVASQAVREWLYKKAYQHDSHLLAFGAELASSGIEGYVESVAVLADPITAAEGVVNQSGELYVQGGGGLSGAALVVGQIGTNQIAQAIVGSDFDGQSVGQGYDRFAHGAGGASSVATLVGGPALSLKLPAIGNAIRRRLPGIRTNDRLPDLPSVPEAGREAQQVVIRQRLLANMARSQGASRELPVIQPVCFIAGTPFMKPALDNPNEEGHWQRSAGTVVLVGLAGMMVAQRRLRRKQQEEYRRQQVIANVDYLFDTGGLNDDGI